MNRDEFRDGFAVGVSSTVSNIGSIPISTKATGQPMITANKDLHEVLTQQATHFSKAGLPKVAQAIAHNIPPDGTALLPLTPEFRRGMSLPLTQQTMIQIMLNKSFGTQFHDRFQVVKMYLALAYEESRFKPLPVGGQYGQLQFGKGTASKAFELGNQLINASPILRNTQAFMQRYAGSLAYNDQVILNVGQMFRIRYRVTEQWLRTKHGWVPKPEIAHHPVTRELMKLYPLIMKSEELGAVALMSVYHTNGIYAFNAPGHDKLDYPVRVAKDVSCYYKLGRIPGLPKAIVDMFPHQLGTLFTEMGDLEDKLGPIDVVSLNEWWKAIIPHSYHASAKGTGQISSPFGHRDAFYNKRTKRMVKEQNHPGEDYGAVIGQPVYALFDGEVTRIHDAGGRDYGLSMVIVSRILKQKQLVGHLSRALYEVTSPKTKVKAGDIIGLAGTSGESNAPHVHVEVRKWPTDEVLNPSKWIKKGKWVINRPGS